MAKTRLTQARVKALRPRKTVRDIRDGNLRDFDIRLHPSARKLPFFQSQHEAKRDWKIVGDAASLSVEDAGTGTLAIHPRLPRQPCGIHSTGLWKSERYMSPLARRCFGN